jgi:Tfp pilus assembly protein FimV
MTLLALVLTAGCSASSPETVTCDKQSFADLMTMTMEAQAGVKTLQLELTSKEAQLQAAKAALAAIPPPAPAALRIKPFAAVTLAVLGAFAAATAIAADFSPELRLGLGITGAAAVAGGFILVFF